MTNYQYKDLTQYGYVKIKVSRNDMKQIVHNRKLPFWKTWEVYVHEDEGHLIIDWFVNIYGKVINTLLSPISVFINGYPDVSKDIKRMWNQKKYGNFTSDKMRFDGIPEEQQFVILAKKRHDY